MSMSISTPVPPLPTNPTSHRSPPPGQTTVSLSTRPALPPRKAAAVASQYNSAYGYKSPQTPFASNGVALQGNRADPNSSSPSGGLGGAGSKLKQALANRKMKKSGKINGQLLDDWEDGNVTSPNGSPSTPSSSLNGTSTQFSFPLARVTSPEAKRMQSDVEGGPRQNGKVTMNPRLRIESKLQAFTAGLRKHHAIMSNPPQLPIVPTPPPKPPGLRIQPSSPTLRTTIIDTTSLGYGDSAENNHRTLSSKASDSHLSTRSNSRPLTPTMIAAQNVAAATSVVSKNVAALAAKVAGTDARNSYAPGGRNSFQMPSSPSISAALSYMQTMPPTEDDGKERKKEKRKSAMKGLKPVPEYSLVQGSSNGTHLASVPPRTDSLYGGGLQSGPRLGMNRSPSKGNKRRSASLGDIFRGGFTPPMAIAALPSTSNNSFRNDGLKPINAAQAFTSRPTPHQRTGSSGSSHDGLVRTPSNPSPLNPSASNAAAAYQYVNAELTGDQPSAFLRRPSPPTGNFNVTPASTAAAISSTPSSIGGIIAPPLPPRRKPAGRADAGGYASAGESSGAESSYNSKGSVLKNNIKGRLAAWTAAANAPPSPLLRNKQLQSNPPGSYCAPSPPSSSPSIPSPATTTSLSPGDQAEFGYARARSNSSHVSPDSPQYPLPNPKRMTATVGSFHPHQMAQYPAATTQPTQPISYSSTVANTAGSLGAAAGVAGGMAFNLGKRGWDRMGNFLGHRAGQSGNWGGLSGYATAGEENTRDSSEAGAMSDTSGLHGQRGGTRMLGPMVRPPMRRSQGAVFGRNLENCVRETRVGSRSSVEADRGAGVWVTALVTRCIEHIMHWGLEEEGLFRITGRSTHVSKIRAEFDTGADYILKEAHPSDLDPHSVSSVLKAYLRELPEPILTRPLAPLFDSAIILGTDNETTSGMGFTTFGGGFNAHFGEAGGGFEQPTTEAMEELKLLMGRLPKENFDLLFEICKLLRATSKNSKTTKMPLSNLLLVFCPSLQLSPAFLRIVVEKQDYLFAGGEMGHVAPSHTAHHHAPAAGQTQAIPLVSSVGPPLPTSPRPRAQQPVTTLEESKRNRTTSVFLPPGFSFTVEAYSESSTGQIPTQPPPLPSRSTTPASVNATPGTPSSTSSASQPRFIPNNAPLPLQSQSLRSRHPSAAKRQPSLASLFSSSKPATPIVISGPIPIPPRSETPSEPPTLDVHLADGSFTVGSPLQTRGDASPRIPAILESPVTSDSDHFRLTEGAPGSINEIPRHVAPPPPSNTNSPPPQLPVFGSPVRQSGDGWAASVLMAAGGSRR